MERNRYPTLARIDRARASYLPRFTASPNTDDLEAFARTLTEEYWGEYTMLTGNISEASFVTVCERLEAHRKHLTLAVSRASQSHDWESATASTSNLHVRVRRALRCRIA